MEDQHQHRQQSCDNCRFRKLKCDRKLQCSNCTKTSLQCQYLRSLRKKGPKGGNGCRLRRLRAGNIEAGQDAFEISTPSTFQQAIPDTPSLSDQTGSLTSVAATRQSEDLDVNPLMDDPSIEVLGDIARLSSGLAVHVQVFMKYVFPIMPIVNGDEILADVFRLDELPPSRYALIMTLCGSTRRQLDLDGIGLFAGRPGVEVPRDPKLTSEILLEFGENAYRQYNVAEDITLDSIASSYFAFCVHASFERFRQAWFYLNQAITLAISLGLDNDFDYITLSDNEQEARRRLFWLLFVTERSVLVRHVIYLC